MASDVGAATTLQFIPYDFVPVQPYSISFTRGSLEFICASGEKRPEIAPATSAARDRLKESATLIILFSFV